LNHKSLESKGKKPNQHPSLIDISLTDDTTRGANSKYPKKKWMFKSCQ
jgi:hypothetical protein